MAMSKPTVAGARTASATSGVIQIGLASADFGSTPSVPSAPITRKTALADATTEAARRSARMETVFFSSGRTAIRAVTEMIAVLAPMCGEDGRPRVVCVGDPTGYPPNRVLSSDQGVVNGREEVPTPRRGRGG